MKKKEVTGQKSFELYDKKQLEIGQQNYLSKKIEERKNEEINNKEREMKPEKGFVGKAAEEISWFLFYLVLSFVLICGIFIIMLMSVFI